MKVSFLDKELVLPVVPDYSYVNSGEPIILLRQENGNPSGYVSLAITMGDFITTYGIGTKTVNEDKSWYWTANDGVQFPMDISFELYEKGGYMAQYILHELVRTDNRADYPNLTDEEFANFRQVRTTGMGDNLYRSSSPIDNEIGRAFYADAAMKAAGVTVVVNISDTRDEGISMDAYKGSYYSSQNVIYLGLGVDVLQDSFKVGLADGLRFMAANPGRYLVHCSEGRDRAGFVSALLECLMGAKPEEVVEDYMATYHNYYGIEPGTDKYDAIVQSSIVNLLGKAFNVPNGYDVTKATAQELQYAATQYIKALGLTDEEIKALKDNLM